MRYRILAWMNGGWYVWQEGLALWQVELMVDPNQWDIRVEEMVEEMGA